MASLTFLAGVVFAMLLMSRLLAVVWGETLQANSRRAAWLLLATTLLMTASLRLSRADDFVGRTQAGSSALLSPFSSSSFSSCSFPLGSFCTSSNGPPGSLLASIKSP